MRKPTNPKSAARWGMSRETVIEAAARTFRRRGIQATTTRDIAKEAGIALGRLYYYFKSKESLVSAVSKRGISALMSEVKYSVASLPQDTSPIGRLEFAIRVHMRSCVQHGDYTMLSLGPSGRIKDADELRPYTDAVSQYQLFWKQLIADAQDSRQLRSDIPSGRFLFFLGGAMTWMASRYQPARGPLDPLIEDVVRIALQKPPIERGKTKQANASRTQTIVTSKSPKRLRSRK